MVPVTLTHYLVASGLLFTIGIVGVIIRRNALMILLAIELMLNAANLSFVAFSRYLGQYSGQIFVFFIMIVAAAEVTVGLAIIIVMARTRGTTDADALRGLKW
ncbi:MAG: NADH-quinone oxidoreductase subunit K [Omnitrophica WOR_2 bacterium RIFCSPHIGHO2_02_FULL_68_15]|nr:MAG: NADH-quinone oxidoreductase subunit K [Omnitrophica WOR_2 bacterium RIFCSPHIGHO2_02_FULL_68_15]